jgi:3-hydroxy-9,10-secoandrosta-1,3,5(10)-triene-9,17-dione monooxygenase reductase component
LPERRERLAELLARANALLGARFDELLKEHGLSPTDGRVLAALHERDGVTMTELGRLLMFSRSRMTKIVDRMQRAQLVQRRRRIQDQDRRVAVVFLAEGARHMVARLLRCAREQDDMLGRALGGVAKRRVKAALTRLMDGLTAPAREETTYRDAGRRRRRHGSQS